MDLPVLSLVLGEEPSAFHRWGDVSCGLVICALYPVEECFPLFSLCWSFYCERMLSFVQCCFCTMC